MISEERIASYIRSLSPEREAVLLEIREEALRDNVPIIRPETEALLLMFLELLRPLRILEVGCAVGYSASLLARQLPEGGILHTIENYEPRIPVAKANFIRAGVADKVTLFEGDATEVLKELEGPYDLIFMDAAKAQYIRWLPRVKELLAPGGLLISDNVLQDGDVLEPRAAIERRNRTIHDRMREYLYTITHDTALQSSVIPVGDGVALTVKKRNE